MARDVYRRALELEDTREIPMVWSDIVIPILFLGVGLLFLGIGLLGPVPRPTESGVGTVAAIFGLWTLIEELRLRGDAT